MIIDPLYHYQMSNRAGSGFYTFYRRIQGDRLVQQSPQHHYHVVTVYTPDRERYVVIIHLTQLDIVTPPLS